ncbi:MAG: hypothetical protein EOP52_13120 [Sphingobacteriales bacterium]|nr:MAG: hypothetical protein EOP52_13120 [Sphingobacteriales bacterium]
MHNFPKNLHSLHEIEEFHRQQSLNTIEANTQFLLHIQVVERVMDLLDLFRQYDTEDQDLKVIQVLGMRQFNAFSSAIKLTLSGYHQTGALILRDVLETVFLVDLFRTDRPAITRWRLAGKSARNEFKPVKVREALDLRDDLVGRSKRGEIYSMFSELAGHASMGGITMLRPKGTEDAYIGPFFDVTALDATLAEMGRLAVQIGGSLREFFPEGWQEIQPSFAAFHETKLAWIREFYPNSASVKDHSLTN